MPINSEPLAYLTKYSGRIDHLSFLKPVPSASEREIIPLYARANPHCGFSCNGVYVEGDKSSIDTVKRWMHDATARLPYFEKLLNDKLTDDEILTRAREAAALVYPAAAPSIRNGEWDTGNMMIIAINALTHINQPLPDPDLIEARALVAGRYPEGSISAGRTVRGDDDDSQAVQNALKAIRRGRELERSK